MRQRLALVIWWCGALAWVGCAVAGFVMAVAGSAGNKGPANLLMIPGGFILAAPFWALAFVIGGSFWRAPRL